MKTTTIDNTAATLSFGKPAVFQGTYSYHAIALAAKLLKDKGQLAIVNLSGRGDKDVDREIE